VQVGGGYQLRTPAEHAPWVRRLLHERPPRLSRPMLETVAIVAYRQPCTRAEIEAIRGVEAEAVLSTLLERRLVRVVGRKEAPGPRRTVVVHKPRGIVSTLDDPEGRPTVRTLLGGVKSRLYPVGRLDVNTTGLLLLTNDGGLAAALLHPRRGVPRVYHAKVRGAPGEQALTRVRRGVHLEDGKTLPAEVRILEQRPTQTWLEITVREGVAGGAGRGKVGRDDDVEAAGDGGHDGGGDGDACEGRPETAAERADATAEDEVEQPEVAERHGRGGEREADVAEAEAAHERPVERVVDRDRHQAHEHRRARVVERVEGGGEHLDARIAGEAGRVGGEGL